MTESAAPFGLRHTIATLAYRAGKVLRDVPPAFATVSAGEGRRSALALVAHLGDLIEWAQRGVSGEMRWESHPQEDWEVAVDRFFAALSALDRALAEAPADARRDAVLFQGPIADALTHVGQLAMLRGLSGRAVRPESYARASIEVGRVGREQTPPRAEYDGDASPQHRPRGQS